MNERIKYLKENIRKKTADIAAYGEIKNKSYAKSGGINENRIWRDL